MWLFSMAVGFVVLLSAALAHAYYVLLDGPWLRVEDVRISGLKHLERKQILNTLGVAKNTSILDIKLGVLAGRLEGLAWLKSSVVRYDPPNHLVVEVVEREPVAVVQAEENFLMDSEGKLFARTTPEENGGLLVITGFTGMKLQEGGYLPPEPRDDLKDLLSALAKAKRWLPTEGISHCQWHGATGLTLFAAPRSVPILLGSDHLDEKLNRLQHIFTALGERQWMDLVTRIDLDYANRAYIEGQFSAPKGT